MGQQEEKFKEDSLINNSYSGEGKLTHTCGRREPIKAEQSARTAPDVITYLLVFKINKDLREGTRILVQNNCI